MANKDLEEDLLAKLKVINKRIDWIASTEGRAALVKGFGANGEFFKEKMALLIGLKRYSTNSLRTEALSPTRILHDFQPMRQ